MSSALFHSMRGTLSSVSKRTLRNTVLRTGRAAFATQSGDDANRPTALAKLHLEDGTTLTGRSFGCHEAVEGEVRSRRWC